ncbi:hypothetical protein GCM10009769_21630 [Curtobacterium luteum]|uniref:Uncharacterized protein n=1 Tax=Curtobacterium luteum TaxID=33881 RepID=A0A8H9L0U6_9MICO|nr:hypothetical protein GCM10009769_21630 [Curtobacterium luteum]
MLVLGALSFAVAIGFSFSSEPFDPVGRAGLPAVVIEVLAAVAGIGCVISGLRGLRRKP